MKTYSLLEVNDIISNQIIHLTQNGFKIDGEESVSNNPYRFKVVLRSNHPQPMTITIRTIMFRNRIKKIAELISINCDNLPELNHESCYNYYICD